jgi:uncharacterized protein involved in exopolysaccharide biosynthesis
LSAQSNQVSVEDDGFNLYELFAILWRSRLWILAFTVVGLLAALTAALVLPKKFEAVIVIAPVSNSTNPAQLGGLGALASQFGGIASMAGISLNGDSRKAESLAVLQSEALTGEYIRRNDLLPVLFYRNWDSSKARWKTSDPEETPTIWKANQYFKKRIREIKTDAKTGLVMMTIRWRNPIIAAKWANDLVEATNDYLRTKAIAESERNINFLRDEASKTNIVEARTAIYSVLQTEINKVMLARGNAEYAFKILDPAAVPEKPVSPLPGLWSLIGAFGGLFLGVFVALARATVWSPQQTV